MKNGPMIIAVFLSGTVWAALSGWAQAGPEYTPGQALLSNSVSDEADGGAAAGESDVSEYAEGTRAINEGRWTDAETIFAKIAGQHGGHADGALYWKAYAENKQGQAEPALATCAELGREFSASSWVHECGALEIEIRARTGKPVAPEAAMDDDLKLLALSSLLQKDEPKALAQIQEILNGDSSEKLKKEAMFILGHHYSDTTYGQIVRISYVEGDVRIARGEENEKLSGATWEKAVADLPLETGFSLVTGAGRAEIEFENASTIYLGENSALSLNDLHTTAGVPYTSIGLLTGTVSVHMHPYVPGEEFVLGTPADELVLRYPHKLDARVNSYVDAMTVTPLDPAGLHLPGWAQETIAQGASVALHDGHPVDVKEPIDPQAFADWDKWVADRVAQRNADLSAVMQDAGLSEPIPGLAAMKGEGKFFDCEPYGKCWEPSGLPSEGQEGNDPAQAATPGGTTATAAAKSAKTGTAHSLQVLSDEEFFPCYPASLRFLARRDPVTGRRVVVRSSVDPGDLPYAWAVCHAGTWIHRRHHYVWVAGHKRHHIPPVRWVKSGHRVAMVPLHPFDVRGRPPINRREEVFAVRSKNEPVIEKVTLSQEHPMEFLKSPPREYRTANMPPLARAEDPRIAAHHLADAQAGRGTIAKSAPGVPLSFDHKLQSFLTSREVTHGNRTVTMSVPLSNHSGNLQAHAASYSGGGAGRGGGTAGGGGSRGGGSSSGGGGHSGGGSSGGTTGGGSGSSSSSGSSAGSSSGGASSGGGGGHH